METGGNLGHFPAPQLDKCQTPVETVDGRSVNSQSASRRLDSNGRAGKVSAAQKQSQT
jgi:hypothetical protein